MSDVLKEPVSAQLHCGARLLDLSRPQVMGVLNVTPDSFSDGGHLHSAGSLSMDKTLRHTEQMLRDGAAIIDVGGESTRPGARPVSLQQEMDRVLPVVSAIAERFDTVISVDTSSPELMLEAAAAGAGLLNDIRALARPGAVAAAAATGLPVCIMHMQGEPGSMQEAPSYENVVDEVCDYLQQRAESCASAGIARKNLLLDPGFGFGKTVEHNLSLLNRLDLLVALGYPVLAGLSRKSLIGKVLGRPVEQRLSASLALAALAVTRGAKIIRAHDVGETFDAIRISEMVIREMA